MEPIVTLGHLTHTEESNWIPRARMILEHGEARVFEPLDRFAQMERYKHLSLGQLLDAFAERRRGNLAALAEMNSRRSGSLSEALTPISARDARPAALHQDGARHEPRGPDRPDAGEAVPRRIGPWRRFVPIVDR